MKIAKQTTKMNPIAKGLLIERLLSAHSLLLEKHGGEHKAKLEVQLAKGHPIYKVLVRVYLEHTGESYVSSDDVRGKHEIIRDDEGTIISAKFPDASINKALKWAGIPASPLFQSFSMTLLVNPKTGETTETRLTCPTYTDTPLHRILTQYRPTYKEVADLFEREY